MLHELRCNKCHALGQLKAEKLWRKTVALNGIENPVGHIRLHTLKYGKVHVNPVYGILRQSRKLVTAENADFIETFRFQKVQKGLDNLFTVRDLSCVL